MKHLVINVEKEGLNKLISMIQEEEDIYKSGLFHIYSGRDDQVVLFDIMKSLRESFPNYDVVGTQSGGEILEGQLMDPGILVSCLLFETTDIKTVVFENIATNERKVGSDLRKYLNRNLGNDLKAAELIFPGALLNTLELYEELRYVDPDICIFGGYAGGHDADLDRAFVMLNGEFFTDALICVLYCGENFYINAAKSAGWHTLGLPMIITKAEGNLLQEIDGMPAAEAYKRYLNIDTDENFIENTNEFPIAAYVDGEELLRHTSQVNEDGSLLLAGGVMPGWKVYWTFGNPTGILTNVNKRLENIYKFNPQAILLYSCFVRKLFWERFVNVEMEPFQKLANVAGFHTFGEVLRNMETGQIMEYNITLLSIAMREGKAVERTDELCYANSSILSGQASLIKRLSELVSSSTMELQNAYQDLTVANEKLKYASEHDSLTGLYNRRKMESLIDVMLLDTKKSGHVSSLVMFDIDHFKKINDTYGHKFGDMVLSDLAKLTLSLLDSKQGQFAGRWGGEEFFIILPNYTEDEGYEFAETFRKRVENYKFGEVPNLTISVGIMTVTGYENQHDVYVRVDSALYKAKDGGRNCVVKV